MKFTVITVTYNCAATIEETIKSVISQKNADVEYIVIDGASTDGTKEILERYADHFAVYISEKDSGIYNAMNKGLRKATGDIISFLNGDDYYLSEDVLSYMEGVFQDQTIDMADGLIHVEGKGDKPPHERMDALYKYMILYHQALFARKSVFDNIGMFDEKYHAAADYDWCLRAYISGVRIKCINRYVTCCRGGGESSKIYCREEFYIIAKKYLIETCQDYLLDEVRDMHHDIFRNMLWEAILGQPSEKLREKLIALFDDTKCILWGTGYGADICYQLLARNNMQVLFYIDSNPSMWGKKNLLDVRGFAKKDCCYKILISSWKYEKEIKSSLEQEGLVNKKDFITFSELESVLAEYGQQYCGMKILGVNW